MSNLTFGCCNFIVINFFLFFIHHVIPPCGISQVTCTLYLYYSVLYLDVLSVTLYRVPYKRFIKCISFFRQVARFMKITDTQIHPTDNIINETVQLILLSRNGVLSSERTRYISPHLTSSKQSTTVYIRVPEHQSTRALLSIQSNSFPFCQFIRSCCLRFSALLNQKQPTTMSSL